MTDSVTVCVASLDTRFATELCIRTLRLNAGHAFSLIVGDSGSSDGSLEMLTMFEDRGWLTLQRNAGCSHAQWLDRWRSEAATRYLVFADSDMDFRRDGWLRDLVAQAQDTGAAMVALDVKPLTQYAREPVAGRMVRGMPAPTTWLFLIDEPQIADIDTSFAFRSVDTDAVPEGCLVYDTGAVILEELEQRGRQIVSMPDPYARGVKHYGSMSWMPLVGEAGRRKRRNMAVIDRRLRIVRALDGPPNPTRAVQLSAAISPPLERALEILARVRWKAARVLKIRNDEHVLVPDGHPRQP